MNVLIACEESQTSCIEFRKLGHNAYSCDIQACSGGFPEWHIKGDCLSLIDGFCSFFTSDGVNHYISSWDLIIAHPPCTYLSKAGSCRMFPHPHVLNLDRYEKAIAVCGSSQKVRSKSFPGISKAFATQYSAAILSGVNYSLPVQLSLFDWS